MAEEEKAGEGKMESEEGKGNAKVKKENTAAKSPVKHVDESEETGSLPGKDESPVQGTKVNGVEKSPAAPVNGVNESPPGSPGKEALIREVDSKECGEKLEEETDDSKVEAEQDEGLEGSTVLDSEHCLRRAQDLLFR